MTLMAVLARYGHVQPSEYDQMDYLVARELGERVMRLVRDEEEARGKLQVELTKALIKAQGATLG